MRPPKSAAAAADLGLGDDLKQQLADQEEQRKRQMMGGKTLAGPAAQSLGLGLGGSGY